MSTLDTDTRQAARRYLDRTGNSDLIDVLGLDAPRRGRRSIQPTQCAVDDCANPPRASGMCFRHYQQQRRARRIANGEVNHGTSVAYDDGCRCDPCRAARSDDGRRRRQTVRT